MLSSTNTYGTTNLEFFNKFISKLLFNNMTAK